MKKFALLLLLVPIVPLLFSQGSITLDKIISKHLSSTTEKKDWGEFKSFSESGKMVFADGRVQHFTFLSKWPGKSKIELKDSLSHRIIYENEEEILVIENGEEKHYSSGPFSVNVTNSKHGYSFALEKRDGLNSKCKYLGDTLINELKFYKIDLTEQHVPQSIIIYLSSVNYQITYVKSTQIQYDFFIYFEDFRWVNGYLIPFKSTHYKYGKLDLTKFIERFSINNIKDSDFYQN